MFHSGSRGGINQIYLSKDLSRQVRQYFDFLASLLALAPAVPIGLRMRHLLHSITLLAPPDTIPD